MADIFQSSLSGLRAFQRALATTSHNISNIDTPGYSRQRTEFTTLLPSLGAGGWIGTGVGVESIRRLVDETRQQAVRVNTSEFARLEAFAGLSGRIDNLLADKDAGLSSAMQAFFNAVQASSADPADLTARGVMLTEAQNLVSRFHYFDSHLAELETEVNGRIEVIAGEINELAGSVARLNQEIKIALGQSQGAPPNDLLDRRDALLEQIAERVGTQVVHQDDGTVSVFIGNGQPLVVGNDASRLTVTRNQYDGTRQELAFVSGNGTVNITKLLTGGTLGGLLDFRRESLDVARNELGLVAMALTEQFNAQHRQGVSFDGTTVQAGGDFFKPMAVEVLASTRNGGGGRPDVSIDPSRLAELTASDYQLRYDGSDWQLTRLSDGQTWPLTDPAPDGLVIDVSGLTGMSAGDSFLIRPTRLGARDMGVALHRPNEIAWANPVLAGEVTGANGEAVNSGTGKIGKPRFNGDVAAWLGAGEITLTYSADAGGPGVAGFTVTGGGATTTFLPYDGQATTLEIETASGTIHVDFNGVPAESDGFVIQPNSQGRGDNANLLALADIKDRPALNGGDTTLEEFYSGVVGRVGAQTQRANVNRDAQNVLLNQAQDARDQVSGVNLDEEAANMLRFQQAYMASAQMITTANTLFQTLLDAVR